MYGSLRALKITSSHVRPPISILDSARLPSGGRYGFTRKRNAGWPEDYRGKPTTASKPVLMIPKIAIPSAS